MLRELGLSPEDTGDRITFVGEDPICPSVHRLGASIGRPKWPGLCVVSARESYLLTLPHNIGAK